MAVEKDSLLARGIIEQLIKFVKSPDQGTEVQDDVGDNVEEVLSDLVDKVILLEEEEEEEEEEEKTSTIPDGGRMDEKKR